MQTDNSISPFAFFDRKQWLPVGINNKNDNDAIAITIMVRKVKESLC